MASGDYYKKCACCCHKQEAWTIGPEYAQNYQPTIIDSSKLVEEIVRVLEVNKDGLRHKFLSALGTYGNLH